MYGETAHYTIREKRFNAMSMGDMQIREYVRFEIVNSHSGDVAHTTNSAVESDTRRIKGLRLNAGNMMKRYEAHARKTGEFFEQQQAREKAIRQRDRRIESLKKEIDQKQTELAVLIDKRMRGEI